MNEIPFYQNSSLLILIITSIICGVFSNFIKDGIKNSISYLIQIYRKKIKKRKYDERDWYYEYIILIEDKPVILNFVIIKSVYNIILFVFGIIILFIIPSFVKNILYAYEVDIIYIKPITGMILGFISGILVTLYIKIIRKRIKLLSYIKDYFLFQEDKIKEDINNKKQNPFIL